MSKIELMLKMGFLDSTLITAIQNNAESIATILQSLIPSSEPAQTDISLKFETELGKLFQGDCSSLLKTQDNDSIDMIFADPPFNLSKLYPSNIDDNLKTEKYLNWCEEWLGECIRVLKPGGSLFLWNLPKWNAALTNFLNAQLSFKNWISADIKYGLPIQGRLYPSHYSLLYYVKGEKPNVFHPDRLPMKTCPKCYGDLTDYGGYKAKMNPLGISLTDVWLDIPPVRHAKYKRRIGANELSLKLLDRIIEMSTDEGHIILDPFGGSGTTYMAAELKNRKWIGCEIGPLDEIIDRFDKIELEKTILETYRSQINTLFTNEIEQKRKKLGIWTCDSIKTSSDN
jgi:site-specific DNA-methyltransferase (adenine-specific)